jgi:hypothetical protein
VAPSSAILEVSKQVAIKPLNPMVTRPKIWMMVRKTFMEAISVYAALARQITKIRKHLIDCQSKDTAN